MQLSLRGLCGLAFVLLASACVSTTRVAAPATPIPATPEPTATAVAPTPVPTATPVPPTPAPSTPTPEPTAEPDTSTTEPDEPPTEEQLALIARTWEDIIATEPYTSIEEVVSTDPQWDREATGGSFAVFDRSDDGQLVNGVFERTYPVGAMMSLLSIDVDVASGYGHAFSDGMAEPGDGGCFEQLDTSDGIWVRTSEGAEPLGDFLPETQGASLTDFLGSGSEEERLATTAWEAVGLTPVIESLADGWTRQFAELTAPGAVAVAQELGDRTGNFDIGFLEVVVGPAGDVRSVTFWVSGIGPERTSSDGSALQSVESAYFHFFAGPFVEPAVRVTPDTPPEESACTSPLANIAGRWNLLSFIAGGSEAPISSIDQMEGAFIQINQDGTIIGSTGCQDFTGTAAIGFDTFLEVDLALTGSPCTSDGLDQAGFETALLASLTPGSHIFLDLEDRLFLSGSINGTDTEIATVTMRFEREP